MEKLSRKEKERLQQKKEILEAALRLFSEKGYHNVSMEQIAKEAEFSVGMLYKFFKSKEDLYRSIIKEVAERFQKALTNAIEQEGDEIEKLRNYLRIKGRLFKENLPAIRLYFAETKGISFSITAGLEKELRRQYNDFLKRLSKLFKSAIEKGKFKKILEPFYLAVALDSISNSFLFLWLEDPSSHPYPDPDMILKILFEGILP